VTSVPSLLVVTAAIKKESDDQRRVREALHKRAQVQGWNVLPFVRTVTIGHSAGPTAGRKVDVLNAQDARHMYRTAHEGPLAVLAVASFRVRPDPSVDPAPDRALWSADDFLRYKAHMAQVRAVKHVDYALQTASRALGTLDCSAATDPRVLPMHVFSPDGHSHALDSIDARELFKETYGSPSSRIDPKGRIWKTGPFHGREILHVAQCTLPPGFHWDVTSGRSTRRCRIVNGWEVWELTGRRGYANIAPNAVVRRGNNECVQRWPR
jgi:hypothetical protein